DECAETSKESQVEIFRLFKLIRSLSLDMETNYVYFCASVYPPYSTNYPSQGDGHSFNFDPGQDAGVVYLQLDELADRYEHFFLEMTRKRLEYIGYPEDDPIKAIFENEQAYYLAAYAANGIPRRYLEILTQAYEILRQKSDSDVEIKKISQKDVEDGLQSVVANQILSRNKVSDRDFNLITNIAQRLGKRNKEETAKKRGRPKKLETEDKEIEIQKIQNVYFT